MSPTQIRSQGREGFFLILIFFNKYFNINRCRNNLHLIALLVAPLWQYNGVTKRAIGCKLFSMTINIEIFIKKGFNIKILRGKGIMQRSLDSRVVPPHTLLGGVPRAIARRSLRSTPFTSRLRSARSPLLPRWLLPRVPAVLWWPARLGPVHCWSRSRRSRIGRQEQSNSSCSLCLHLVFLLIEKHLSIYELFLSKLFFYVKHMYVWRIFRFLNTKIWPALYIVFCAGEDYIQI